MQATEVGWDHLQQRAPGQDSQHFMIGDRDPAAPRCLINREGQQCLHRQRQQQCLRQRTSLPSATRPRLLVAGVRHCQSSIREREGSARGECQGRNQPPQPIVRGEHAGRRPDQQHQRHGAECMIQHDAVCDSRRPQCGCQGPTEREPRQIVTDRQRHEAVVEHGPGAQSKRLARVEFEPDCMHDRAKTRRIARKREQAEYGTEGESVPADEDLQRALTGKPSTE